MKNENLINDILARILITEITYKVSRKTSIGRGTIRFDLDFDSTHESCKWFKDKIQESEEIRDAIADNIINKLAEPVDGFMERIKEDRLRENGFCADINLELWDDEHSSWVLTTVFPL